MSAWTKQELENMLEDVVNVLHLSDEMIEKHGPLATPPAELVAIILSRKEIEIQMLKRGFLDLNYVSTKSIDTFLKKCMDDYARLLNFEDWGNYTAAHRPTGSTVEWISELYASQFKAKAEQLEKENERLISLLAWVNKQFEDDGMENMHVREEVIYKTVKQALQSTEKP